MTSYVLYAVLTRDWRSSGLPDALHLLVPHDEGPKTAGHIWKPDAFICTDTRRERYRNVHGKLHGAGLPRLVAETKLGTWREVGHL